MDTVIQPDEHGQLKVVLPVFVDDPEAYLRQDTQFLRQHLARMDAQAYSMLIWRALQMDVLSQLLVQDDDSNVLLGTSVSLAFEPHPNCPPNIGQCVVDTLTENLNSLQSDAIAPFIQRLKSTGWMTRETADDVIGSAYDHAFADQGAPSWKQARSAQESLRIDQGTPQPQTHSRPGRRI